MGVGDNSWREKQDLFICLKPKKIGLRPTSTSSRLSLWSLELQLLPLQPCSGEKLIVVTTCLSSSIAFSVTKNNFWTKPNQRMLLQSCDCPEETESYYSVKYSGEKLWPFHIPAFALQVKIWMWIHNIRMAYQVLFSNFSPHFDRSAQDWRNWPLWLS